ncbi:MAG: hypothetical protein M3248_01395 [Actinomycetota bacterium]|nr:hypothetical protein [Actinomycetota bacterium]
MTEQEIVYLSGPDSPIGISRHDAQLRLVDDDLWLLDAEGRYGFEDDEAVQQWAQAVESPTSDLAQTLRGTGISVCRGCVIGPAR